MTIRTNTHQLGEQAVGHPDEVREVYERLLADAQVGHRYIETRSGRRVHLIEAGEGPPVVLLHGGGTSSMSHVPLLAHLEGVRAINVDRPGFGLSDPVRVPRERYRDGAIEFIDEVLDALGLESTALAGASGGGSGPSGTPSPIRNGCAGSCCSRESPSCPEPVSRRPCE